MFCLLRGLDKRQRRASSEKSYIKNFLLGSKKMWPKKKIREIIFFVMTF